jgi:TPP-dependent indolepyruvate ferredoxin oxidoreductase alpha subunit
MELSRDPTLLDEYGIIFQPGVNEELAATTVQGSQLALASQGCTVDGVIGFWYGKSVGAAYQTGRLPLRAQHIEEAIRGSGVKVQ